ncbi:metal-dependent hydrolase [Peribacillus cavernae]|uniref:Metal-dependent hydrolase n=1 Tax=Peribacillus cavernae TaxID=1674310 RepID=A0A3S0VUF6_9BACI|nr:metal-dependent hydrolase [Peribacillus cavernae]MDQ0220858.1 inner membrane protein [Peribacillus cavernae]RUQ24864.1 metal-dependent hydrolase [Peribacillus cavernae]
MDTGTHFVMGIALGGLATLDPAVAEGSVTATAVMVGTILGSQAPDIDTFLKLRNNAVYIRNHRGLTHSLPAVLLWPLLISGTIYALVPESNLFHLWIWTFLAVFLHVFVDIFNAYGTQALRPISSKWVALGIINTFDPFIFGIHIAGLILWGLGSPPGYTFLSMYGILVIYYLARFREQRIIKKAVKMQIPEARKIIMSSTMRYHRWKVAVITEKHFYVARANNGAVTILDQFERVPLPVSEVLDVAKYDKNLAAFLSFSPVYRWEIESNDTTHEVRFIDLRYRSNGFYPFVAVVHLDRDLNITNSYTGWIFSEAKLRKKLNILPG